LVDKDARGSVTIRSHAHCQQAQHLLYITYLSYNQILIALQIH
jgi:hypothetical protein